MVRPPLSSALALELNLMDDISPEAKLTRQRRIDCEESAKQRRRPFVVWVALAAALAIGAFIWFQPRPSEHQAASGGAGGPVAPVVTEAVATEDFIIRRRTIGILESPATIIIRSRIDSQVLEQHVTDGQIVKKSELLFTLDDREIKATIARDEATIAKDQAVLTQAEAALNRTQELITKNVASQQQLEQAQATFKSAQQTVEADHAVLQADQLKLGYAKLEAPIAGRIGAIRVAPGNLVSPNDTAGLVTLTQMQPLRVTFTLPERDLAALRAAALHNPPASVRVYAPSNPDPLATGILDFVDSSVDSSSGTIMAKATFPNEEYRLWPGQYVDVELDLAVRPNTAMLPTVAIQTGQKGPYVFVAKADQTVEMRKVALAGATGNRTAIASGLNGGERVVVEGQLRLTQGTRWREAEPAPGRDKAGSLKEPPARTAVTGQ
jgi:multidrug efflux system membrane fusion protein